MMHRYALASKTLPSELKATFDDVINMVNFIKSSTLNTGLFFYRLLCQARFESRVPGLFLSPQGVRSS